MTDPVLGMLLADIVAHPGDDGPRLAFADRLEETGADDARAEFVRVQTRLGCGCKVCDGTGRNVVAPCPCAFLRRRERELLSATGAVDVPVKPQARLDWAGRLADILPWDLGNWVFRRGFVEEVSIAWAGWRAWGAVLVRELPLRAVRLLGKEPTHYDGPEPGMGYWRWFDGSRAGGPDSRDPDELPSALWPYYAAEMAQRRQAWDHPDRADAEACLSAACLAWARAVASPAPARVD